MAKKIWTGEWKWPVVECFHKAMKPANPMESISRLMGMAPTPNQCPDCGYTPS